MNDQEKFMILLTEQYIKYKKKYKQLFQDFEDYKKNNLLSTNNILLNNQNTIDYINIVKETIHPEILQNNEGNNIDIFNIDDLIKNAVDKALDKNNFYNKLYDINIIFDKQNYIKQGRDSELRKVVTDFVNKYFLGTDHNFYAMLISFYNFASKAITNYIQQVESDFKSKYTNIYATYDLKKNVILIFKGGNILKGVYLKYKYELPGIVSDKIDELFNEYFSRSDLDFQIVIDSNFTTNDVENETIYEDLVERLGILTYWILYEFKKSYIYRLDETFDFYQVNNKSKISKLNSLKNNLNSTLLELQKTENFDIFLKNYGAEYSYYKNMKINNIFFNNVCLDTTQINLLNNADHSKLINYKSVKRILDNKIYNFRDDIYVDKVIDSSKDDIMVKIINQESEKFKCEHYISLIKNIYFKNDETGLIRNFSLIRTKINFVAQFTTNDGGEEKQGLINIPGELIDVSISKFNDDRTKKKIKDEYTEYSFDGFGNTIFKFFSYSMKGMINDLFSIIFVDSKFPWEDPKYKKRLFRLFFLSLIDILSLKKNETDLNKFLGKLTKISKEVIDNILNNQNYFENLFSGINNSKITDSTLYIIFKQHIKMYYDANLPDNKEMFKGYYENIMKILQDIQPLLDLLSNFCNSKIKGKIDTNNLEFRKLHQFGGKHYKIKNKK